ncbi:MAG: hypothetical protein ACD_79C00949G0003 [uncultured bacterium]|nr:MAG: hypothetical protein ACD_79C00949G0003 [uncultured bacterium]
MFSFRKSKRLGTFSRLNFSKSGLGLSFGVRGARIGVGPAGTFLSLGKNGFFYRKKLNCKTSIDSYISQIELNSTSIINPYQMYELNDLLSDLRQISMIWSAQNYYYGYIIQHKIKFNNFFKNLAAIALKSEFTLVNYMNFNDLNIKLEQDCTPFSYIKHFDDTGEIEDIYVTVFILHNILGYILLQYLLNEEKNNSMNIVKNVFIGSIKFISFIIRIAIFAFIIVVTLHILAKIPLLFITALILELLLFFRFNKRRKQKILILFKLGDLSVLNFNSINYIKKLYRKFDRSKELVWK